jgi:hypothetical protein
MHGTSAFDRMETIFFLAYHQVRAHKRFMKENPDEVVHFKCFQLWYSQQVAGGHAPGRTPGDNRFWAEENM